MKAVEECMGERGIAPREGVPLGGIDVRERFEDAKRGRHGMRGFILRGSSTILACP